MAVLVTGGAGYIGSHMVLALADSGEKVIVADDLSTGLHALVDKRAFFCECDIGNTETMTTLLHTHKVDAVIHMAGSVVVPESVRNPLKYYQNNTQNSCNLIKACIKAGVQYLVFSSTAAVYGTPALVPVHEDTALNPVSPYGMSKLMTEQMLRDVAAAHSLNYASLRYFNVAGADPDGRAGQSSPEATHLIKVATRTVLGLHDGMEIFGTDYDTPDGTAIRDYIHVTDLVQAHIMTLAWLRSGGDKLIANCGYGHGYSVREVIAAVEKAARKKIHTRETGPRAGDPVTLVAASDHLRASVGWQPRLDDLGLIVQHALDWERKCVQSGIS